MNNPVGYLPTSGDLTPITYNNVPINPVSGGKIGCQLNFTNGSNNIGKYITYYVNGVQMPPFQGGPFYTSTSIAFNFAFAGGIQNGDDIVCIITDIPGFAPLVESVGVTSYSHTVSDGDVTMIVENNSTWLVDLLSLTNSTGGTLMPFPASEINPSTQVWMPLEYGESVTLNGVHRWLASGVMSASLFISFDGNVVANRRFKHYVNDVLVSNNVISAGSFGNNFQRAGNTNVLAGDVIRYVIENA